MIIMYSMNATMNPKMKFTIPLSPRPRSSSRTLERSTFTRMSESMRSDLMPAPSRREAIIDWRIASCISSICPTADAFRPA